MGSKLKEYILEYDKYLKENFCFVDITANEFSKEDLRVLVVWLEKYYRSRLKENDISFDLLTKLLI